MMKFLRQGILNLITIFMMVIVFLIAIRFTEAINYYTFPTSTPFDFYITGPLTENILKDIKKNGTFVGYLEYRPIVQSKDVKNYVANLIVFDNIKDINKTWYKEQTLVNDLDIGENIVGLDYLTAKRLKVWLGDSITVSFPKENISLNLNINTIYRTNYFTDNRIVILRASWALTKKEVSNLNQNQEVYSSIIFSGDLPKFNYDKLLLVKRVDMIRDSHKAIEIVIKNGFLILFLPLLLGTILEYSLKNVFYPYRVGFIFIIGILLAFYFELNMTFKNIFIAVAIAIISPKLIALTLNFKIKKGGVFHFVYANRD